MGLGCTSAVLLVRVWYGHWYGCFFFYNKDLERTVPLYQENGGLLRGVWFFMVNINFKITVNDDRQPRATCSFYFYL